MITLETKGNHSDNPFNEKRVAEYKGCLVSVLCIEPNDVWAMVREHAKEPFCVRVRDLTFMERR